MAAASTTFSGGAAGAAAAAGEADQPFSSLVEKALSHMRWICDPARQSRLNKGLFYPLDYYGRLGEGNPTRLAWLQRDGSFFNGHLPPRHWERLVAAEGQRHGPTRFVPLAYVVKEGSTPCQALDAAMEGPSLIDCVSASRLALHLALRDVVGDEKYDHLFRRDGKAPLVFGRSDAASSFWIQSVRGDPEPGDLVHIENSSVYSMRHPRGSAAGFSVMRSGAGYLGFGLGAGALAEEEVLRHMADAFNKPGDASWLDWPADSWPDLTAEHAASLRTHVFTLWTNYYTQSAVKPVSQEEIEAHTAREIRRLSLDESDPVTVEELGEKRSTWLHWRVDRLCLRDLVEGSLENLDAVFERWVPNHSRSSVSFLGGVARLRIFSAGACIASLCAAKMRLLLEAHQQRIAECDRDFSKLGEGMFYSHEYRDHLLQHKQMDRFNWFRDRDKFYHGHAPASHWVLADAGERLESASGKALYFFVLKTGAEPSAALDALVKGPTLLDCGSVAQVAMYQSLRDALGPERFNQVFRHGGPSPLIIDRFSTASSFWVERRTREESPQAGDLWVFNGEEEYSVRHPRGSAGAYQVIFSGTKYLGFGLDPEGCTEDQLLQHLADEFNRNSSAQWVDAPAAAWPDLRPATTEGVKKTTQLLARRLMTQHGVRVPEREFVQQYSSSKVADSTGQELKGSERTGRQGLYRVREECVTQLGKASTYAVDELIRDWQAKMGRGWQVDWSGQIPVINAPRTS